jgi:hypothetical protein
MWHFSDPLTAADILKLLGAAALGFFSSVTMEFVKRRMGRNARIAAHLVDMAGALQGMVLEFSQSRIPYMHGHLLDGTLKKSEHHPPTRAALANKLYELKDLSGMAKDDDIRRELGKPNHTLTDKWIKDALRMAGDLQSDAAALKLD